MSYHDLREPGDVFVRRLVRLLRYVAADPYLNMYYFYDSLFPEMVFKLEDIPGFRLVLDGRPAPGSIRGGNPMHLGIGVGVFQIEEEKGIADPEAIVRGLDVYSAYPYCVVVTDEEDFPERGMSRMLRMRRQDGWPTLLVSKRSMLFDCTADELDLSYMFITYYTRNEELAKVFGDPV